MPNEKLYDLDEEQEIMLRPKINPHDVPHRQILKCYTIGFQGHADRKFFIRAGEPFGLCIMRTVVYEPQEFRGFVIVRRWDCDKAPWAFTDFLRMIGCPIGRSKIREWSERPFTGCYQHQRKTHEQLEKTIDNFSSRFHKTVSIDELEEGDKYFHNFGPITTRVECTGQDYPEFQPWSDAPPFADTELAIVPMSPETRSVETDDEDLPF